MFASFVLIKQTGYIILTSGLVGTQMHDYIPETQQRSREHKQPIVNLCAREGYILH